jgi:catalase
MHPEATHMFMWTQSDRAIPRSFRMMQGFGVNTFTLLNKSGERCFVKFVFTPELGVHSLVWDEALKLAGQDPDFHRKDLWDAIENGAFPKWKFGIQVIPEANEHDFEFDILDATKIWPEDLVPIRYIGELELNRNPDEFFPQTEQVAFCTSHVVPGIGFSDDPLLQGRNFSYFDTQITRIGINFEELPINRPICPVMNNNRDGAMRHTAVKSTVNYWPNRFEHVRPATTEEGGYIEHPSVVDGIKARVRSTKFREHYNQAQLFYNSLSDIEKKHILAALSFELDHCDDPRVYERVVQRLADIDTALSQDVGRMVGAPTPRESRKNHSESTIGISQLEYMPEAPTISTRRIALLIADGYDQAAYDAAKSSLTDANAFTFTIGTRRSFISAAGKHSSSSKGVKPDHHLEGMRSTMFDAILIPGGAESIATLRENSRARHWICEAFGHLKAIGAIGEAVELVRQVCELDGMAFSSGAEVVNSYGVVTASEVEARGLKTISNMSKNSANFIDAFAFAVSQHRNWDRELDGLSNSIPY